MSKQTAQDTLPKFPDFYLGQEVVSPRGKEIIISLFYCSITQSGKAVVFCGDPNRNEIYRLSELSIAPATAAPALLGDPEGVYSALVLKIKQELEETGWEREISESEAMVIIKGWKLQKEVDSILIRAEDYYIDYYKCTLEFYGKGGENLVYNISAETFQRIRQAFNLQVQQSFAPRYLLAKIYQKPV